MNVSPDHILLLAGAHLNKTVWLYSSETFCAAVSLLFVQVSFKVYGMTFFPLLDYHLIINQVLLLHSLSKFQNLGLIYVLSGHYNNFFVFSF